MRLAGLTARLQGFWHLLRGHNIEWRAYKCGGACEGDIVCKTCKLVIWCRCYMPDNAQTSRTIKGLSRRSMGKWFDGGRR